MAKFNTIQGGLNIGAGKTFRRKLDDSGWEEVSIPTIKRIETYRGTTNASGRYTITYPTAFSSNPTVIPSIMADSAYRLSVRVVSSSTTGCVIEVAQRNASFLSLLGLDILTSGVTVQNNVSVDILVVSQ